MIILNKKKIIIFHNRKTSGTSFGILMSLISSKGDYISFHPVSLNVNKKIIKKINLNKNQNFFNIEFVKSAKSITYNILLYLLKKIFKTKYINKKYNNPFIIYKSKYDNHTTPEYFKKYIDNKIYNDYSKFAIYRKFSDQLYSMYNHIMSYEKFMSYEEWVSKNLESFYKSSLKFYQNDIYYFNFHKMESSLKKFCEQFRIEEDLSKQYKNIKQRTKNRKYANILKSKTKKKILTKEKKIYKIVRNKLLSK